MSRRERILTRAAALLGVTGIVSMILGITLFGGGAVDEVGFTGFLSTLLMVLMLGSFGILIAGALVGFIMWIWEDTK